MSSWEIERRSVAMLAPGAPALTREEALEVLGVLVEIETLVRRTAESAEVLDDLVAGLRRALTRAS